MAYSDVTLLVLLIRKPASKAGMRHAQVEHDLMVARTRFGMDSKARLPGFGVMLFRPNMCVVRD